MMHDIRDVVRRLFAPFVDAFKTAPFEVLIAGFAALWSSFAIHRDGVYADHAAEVLTACALSFVGAFILSALHRFGGIAQRERLISTALACVLFGAMSGLVLDLELQTNIWRVGLLGSALVCVLPLTPLARQDADESMSVWRFSLNITTRSIVALAYGFAMQAAIAVAFLALDELFSLSIGPDGYTQIAALVFIAFVPSFVAAGLDTMATESTIADSLSKTMLERAGKWLVAPALSTYLLIIYTYTVKVVATGSAPENLLSPLALGAATLGIAAIFFFEPMARRERPDWFSYFVRWLPIGLLAGLPLAAWAIWQRIDQHGWTEFRYFRLLLVLGFALVFLLTPFVRRRREHLVLRVAPAVFGVLLVLASIGPFSASHTSRTSQLEHLRDDLHAAGLDLRGGLDEEDLEDTSYELKSSLASRTEYLRDKHGSDTLAHLLGDREIDSVISRLRGYPASEAPVNGIMPTYASAESPRPITVTRASRVVGATLHQHGGAQDVKGWQIELEGQQVEVATGARLLETDIEPVTTALTRLLEGQGTALDVPEDVREFALVDTSGEVQGKLFVRAV
ncbi:MAG: DUF4153 domain-containing protein, partial [Myxococcota bacterium]